MVKTMKKSLAIILSLAVCLSVLCVPAMASDSTAAHDFPYMLFDFEDGISFTTSSRATIVEGGMGGSGHALQIVEDNTVTSGEYQLLNKWGSNLSATIPAGHTFELSFWVKNAAPLAQMQFNIVYDVPGYPGASGNPASTDWQKITIRYTPTEDYTLGANRLRFGGLGVSTNPLEGCTGSEPGERTYLIDDFEMKILDPNAESDVDQIENLDGYRMNFENGASMRLMVPGAYHRPSEETSVTNGNETLSIVANPLGNGKVLKIDLTDAQSGNGSLALCNMKASSNNYPNAPVTTVPVGSTITYTFKYYFPQEMASDNNPGFCMYHGTGDGYTEKYINSNNVKTTANEWHTAKISWTNNTEADATLKHSSFRICYSENANSLKVATLAEGETQYGNRSIYIDDIAVDVTSPADATVPISSNLIVTNDVAAGKTVRFVHTLTPASTSAAGVTDASVVRLVNIANDGTAAVINYCGVNQPMVITSIPADSKKLVFEVVPVSSDAKVGNAKEYPAEKSSITETAVANALPYMLCTYEDGMQNFSGGTIVEGGIGGSGHALQMISTYLNASEPYSAPYLKDKAGNNLGGTIPAGATLKISFWAKAITEIDKLDFHLVSYNDGIGDCANGSVRTPVVGQWYKITLKYTPSVTKTFSSMYFRGYFEGTYLMDDFEAVILDANAEKLDNQYANLDGFRENFEGTVGAVHFTIPSTGRPNVQTTAKDNTVGVTFQIVDNPAGEGQVMKVDLADTKRGDDVSLSLSSANSTDGWAGNNKPSATVPAGATLKYTFKYYWAQEMDAENSPAFGVLASNGGNIFASGTEFATAANEWHTATITWTNETEADTTVTTNMLLFCAPNNPGRTWKTLESEGYSYANGAWTGAAGERTVYIDDFKVDVIPAGGKATAPVSSGLEVLGTVAVDNGVWFHHTFTPASTSAAGTADASIVSLVSYNAAGARNILKTVTVANGMNIPAIPADSAKLVFEVVPMSDDGKVGNVAVYPIETSTPEVPDTPDEPEVITETKLVYADGLVKVSAAEDINNAYIIFVSYDASGRMVDYDMAYVTLSAQESGDFAPYEDFVTSVNTKAILWEDLDGCVPLATAIQY